jgi:peptidoglycan/xylan/chitin deacetylase (PgdA/CDA1 family)
VKLCVDTGLRLTFNPVGALSRTWEQHASVLRPLIERGQVQIGNHTYHHQVLTGMPEARIRDEIERADDWIQKTFGVTSRPYLRPPGGLHDERTDAICGELGYTKILMWESSFGDSQLLSPEQLLSAASRALFPGAVVLGHANHPTVTHLYPLLLEMIQKRRLEPSTLDEMFGTSRATG